MPPASIAPGLSYAMFKEGKLITPQERGVGCDYGEHKAQTAQSEYPSRSIVFDRLAPLLGRFQAKGGTHQKVGEGHKEESIRHGEIVSSESERELGKEEEESQKQ